MKILVTGGNGQLGCEINKLSFNIYWIGWRELNFLEITPITPNFFPINVAVNISES